MRRLLLLSVLSLLIPAMPAPAHFSMLLPSAASAKKDEAVTFTYQWGHPFEHQLFDAPMPESVVVIAPDGEKSELTKALEKIAIPSGDKKATAYRFAYTPKQRGDYVFLLRTAPLWMEEEGAFVQDIVKVVLHVQAQKGWDNSNSENFEWSPLTRPYGLVPGMVFQARIQRAIPNNDTILKPFGGAQVEIEHYNAAPPKMLPPDEQITRTAKTDPNGVITTTLTDPGWWSLTVARPRGMKERDGKQVPLRERCTLWVHVDEQPRK